MTNNEKLLLAILAKVSDSNAKAVILQSFIAEYGPLSEEAGEAARRALKKGIK